MSTDIVGGRPVRRVQAPFDLLDLVFFGVASRLLCGLVHSHVTSYNLEQMST